LGDGAHSVSPLASIPKGIESDILADGSLPPPLDADQFGRSQFPRGAIAEFSEADYGCKQCERRSRSRNDCPSVSADVEAFSSGSESKSGGDNAAAKRRVIG
jgi:hypothetical protein